MSWPTERGFKCEVCSYESSESFRICPICKTSAKARQTAWLEKLCIVLIIIGLIIVAVLT